MTERWLPVVGYEGRYEVSDLGRVRQTSGLVMKTTPNYAGYHVISLSPDRKQHRLAVLVLTAFRGPRPDGMQACHGPDFSLDNNRLDNLRWDTREANLAERNMPAGEQHYNAKLSDESRAELVRRRRDGEMLKVLAAEYGVTMARVSQLARAA